MRTTEAIFLHEPSQRDAMFVRLCRARDMMRQHPDRRLRINEVAEAVALSPYHFIRVFRAVFGETPYQVRLAARIDRAKQLLLLADSSVTDICADVGFASLGTFSHQFTRRVGLSPTQYRKEMRPMLQVPTNLPQSLYPGCLTLMSGSAQ
jgi:AraC-like DNA-binding protein